MAVPVVRFQQSGEPRWGVLFGNRIAPVDGDYPTTGDLLRNGRHAIRNTRASHATLPVTEVQLLTPVTVNQQLVCQGINYASHVRESGMDPDKIAFNTIFTKAPSSICGARDAIVRPAHVRLLDYEIELGLVVGRDISGPVDVGPEKLGDFLAGVTIVNDVSARDVQLPQVQFYKGKSYRTFCPVGPVLLLLTASEWQRWGELHMRLSVNGEVRQDAKCGEMIFAPHRTLTELSALQNLAPGDLIATGTPAGCALRAPGKAAMFVMRHFMSDATKWRLFLKKASQNPRYLKPGDEVVASIHTDDGTLDLGEQRNQVVAA
jgi:2-keto-4-pentenoate hydratase/2-oxohepta-3-ene-1,7-dioic acid hydratase in catechol pathway